MSFISLVGKGASSIGLKRLFVDDAVFVTPGSCRNASPNTAFQ
jgi:hypothetical protein